MNKLLLLLFFALDKVDPKLAEHSRRVASLARYLARTSYADAKFTQKVTIAGLLHDIGFLKMNMNFSERPMHMLNEEERQYSATHSDEGVNLISGVINDPDILDGIRHHHEMYDGSGKPQHLAGEEIPLIARFLVVADIYDTLLVGDMFGDQRNTPAYVREQLIKFSGHLTDPEITSCLLKLLNHCFVFHASEGEQKLIYKVSILEQGPLSLGNLVSHDGTILCRKGAELTEQLLEKLRTEYPGQKILVPVPQ